MLCNGFIRVHIEPISNRLVGPEVRLGSSAPAGTRMGAPRSSYLTISHIPKLRLTNAYAAKTLQINPRQSVDASLKRFTMVIELYYKIDQYSNNIRSFPYLKMSAIVTSHDESVGYTEYSVATDSTALDHDSEYYCNSSTQPPIAEAAFDGIETVGESSSGTVPNDLFPESHLFTGDLSYELLHLRDENIDPVIEWEIEEENNEYQSTQPRIATIDITVPDTCQSNQAETTARYPLALIQGYNQFSSQTFTTIHYHRSSNQTCFTGNPTFDYREIQAEIVMSATFTSTRAFYWPADPCVCLDGWGMVAPRWVDVDICN